jgi:hypothetical protein
MPRLRHALALLFLSVAGTGRGQDLNVISAVAVKDEGASVVLTVTGTKPPNFTTFSMADPPRFVLDFSEAKFQGVPEDMPIEGPVILVVKNLSYGSDATSIARIMIAFAVDVEPPDVQAQGSSLVVRIAKPGGSGAAVAAADPAADRARELAEAQRRAEAEAAERAEAERQAQAAAEAKARTEVEAQARAEADRRAQEAPQAPGAADLEKLRAEREALGRVELARLAAEEAAAAKAAEEAAAAKVAEEAAAAKVAEEAAAAKVAEEAAAAKVAEEKAAEEARQAEARRAQEDAERQRQEALAAAQAEAEKGRQEAVDRDAEAERQRRAEAVAAARADAERKKVEEAERRAEAKRQREEAIAAAKAEAAQKKAEAAERRAEEKRQREEARLARAGEAALQADAPSAQLREIGFRQMAGVSRVFVRTSVPARFTIQDVGDNMIRVELENTRLLRRNDARFLDTSFFPSAVAMISPSRRGSSYVVDIKLREKVPYQQRIEGDMLAIDFERPAAAGAPAPGAAPTAAEPPAPAPDAAEAGDGTAAESAN